MEKRERVAGPDIIRTLAIILVMFTHMLSYSVRFNEGLHTPKWLIYVILHYVCLAAVPLFLLLTGYLSSSKKLSKGYFKGIIPILLSYAIISVISILFDRFVYGAEVPLWRAILSVLNFTAIDYAWYVEMYIGLFLLIPFLNMIKDALQDRKQWHILLAVLAFLTAMPDVAGSFIFGGVKLNIVPDWWVNLYPVTFYFLGAYIKEFQPKVKKLPCFAGAIGALAVSVGLCVIFSVQEYAWWVMHGVSALPTMMFALSIFLMFYSVTTLPKVIAVPIREIAVCSYEMYLFSYITDKYLYAKLPFNGIVTLAINFALCFALSFALRIVLRPITKLVKNRKKEVVLS